MTLRSPQLATGSSAPLPAVPVQQQQQQQQPASQFPAPQFGGGALRDRTARTGKKLTAADISMPTNFQHVVHVGWSAQNGFDLVDNDPNGSEKLNSFLKKAGVSQQELSDRKTRQFIYDFIESNNVLKLDGDGGQSQAGDTAAPGQQQQSGGKTRGGGGGPPPPPVPSRHTVSANTVAGC